MLRGRHAIGTWSAALAALLALVLVLALPTALRAEEAKTLKGVALVIGQSKYEHLAPLANPEIDARAIEALLNKLGFETTPAIDRNAKQLGRALSGFIEDAESADVALVYYSGHGIEAGGENYLIPTDANLESLGDAGKALIPLSDILARLEDKARIVIVLLDACRSNPFPPGALLKTGSAPQGVAITAGGLVAVKGMVPVTEAADINAESLGQVIGFAAQPGMAALDGEPGQNSPYAAALIKHLPVEGVEFGDVMTMVTEEVYLQTGNRQQPWTNTSLRRLLSFGGTAEETAGDEALIRGERRKLLLTIAATPQDLRRTVETLAQADKLPLAPLYGMLKELKVDTSAGAEDLDKQLRAGAENLKKIVAERVPVVREDAEVAKFVQLADRAQAEGAIALALDFRGKASARVAEFAKSLDRRQAEVDTGRKQVAATFAEEAETAVLAFDYARAAKRFGEAFGQVERIDRRLAWRYKLGEADALSKHGIHKGINEALASAITAYSIAVQSTSRETNPDDWAATQNNLGLALTSLGERESGTATLEKAVAAYEAALSESTRERVPLDWAVTQNNLGLALTRLGERESGTATLEKAVAAYKAALGESTREDVPLQWAMTQNNLGLALTTLGERESDTATLEAAVAAYEAALRESTRERVPLDWAMTQNNLGNALIRLGEREVGTTTLEKAIAAYEASLTEFTRARVPLRWATTKSNLGTALRILGERKSDRAMLAKAVIALNAALSEQTRERVPLDWAMTQTNLGGALTRLGERENGTSQLEKAVAAYRAALTVWTRDRTPLQWATTQDDLGTALQNLGESESGTAMLEQAVAAYENALKERTRERVPLDWAMTQNNLGNVLTSLGERGSGSVSLDKAVAAYEAALSERTRERVPLDWAMTQNNLGNALRVLGERQNGTTTLEKAVVAFEAALSVRTRERVPLDWAMTQDNLGGTLGLIGVSVRDATIVRRGKAAVGAAWELHKKAGNAQYDAYFARRIAAFDAALAKLGQK